MTDPLIRTKLHPPFIRTGLVPRPRLQARIAEGLRGPLTLVIAPAGFGKTNLTVPCVAECGIPVAWLSLDKNDNQVGRFLSYLIAALQEADSTLGSEAAQLMAASQQALPEAILTSLVNDLYSASGEIILVLDDYQLISSQAVHEKVAFLLEHQPSTLHLVIATRSDPPLPLARLRARGQTVELRADDLRFTEFEAAQFLNDFMGLQLEAGLVVTLEERTEGWIAGLQMAALSMRDREDVRGFIDGFSGTNRYILDYLLEEVLARESNEFQEFLLQTAILDRLCGPLCDAVIGHQPERVGAPVSQRMLESLERRGLFVIPLDDNCCWYRYHHLFADLLQSQLRQSRPDLIPTLHIRAYAWLEEKGFITEAIQHLLSAQEMDRAADLIERYGPARWAESDRSVLQMADGLPPEMLISRPKIGLYQAWLFIILGLVEKAVPLLKDLAQHVADADSHAGGQWMQTMIGLALAFLGHRTSPGFDSLPDYQVIDEIPASEPILRDAADVLYAMTLGRRGEFERASEVAVKCIQRQKTSYQTLTIPTLPPFLARIYLLQGRLNEAASLCREFLELMREKGIRFIYSAGSMNIVLGEVLYERNRLEEAEKQIRDGLQANEPWSDIMSDAWGLLALIRVLRARGDDAGALQNIEKFETRLQQPLRPHEFEEDFHTLRVRLQLASGDLQTASHWADEIQHSENFRLHPEYYRLTLACIGLMQERYGHVEKILTGASSVTAAGNRIARQIETNLLLAVAIAGQQRLLEAFGIIEASLALAEPEGYIRIFLDIGRPARELLAAYLRSDAPAHKRYAQKVLEAFSDAKQVPSPGSQPTGLIEPLSGRELEVLDLIALGKTNQEIAQHLIVAPGTVKAHTASIYRKLNVANRTEATARARQLGILS
ncbi:MAG: LuxR C-terminal-related transcriptional regulator [Chloroflexota bacterium]